MYTELMEEESVVELFIKEVEEEDAGNYSCSGMYASNQELEETVEVLVYSPMQWLDAPEEQYGVAGEEGRIRCLVKASPPARIDWVRDGD